MAGKQTRLVVETRGAGLYEFTDAVARFVREAAVDLGLLTLFVRHTSCSLLIQENADPDVRRDLSAFFARLVPPADDPAMGYLTHRAEGPDDMPAHIKAAVLPVSLSIPVSGGRLALGTWQGIYLFEHRTSPHRREVVLHLA
ncbi:MULTISPECIES: secondary thiamine-phosphate synthase enzyme YjbQ [unclassified Bosea (in: a-proteobacteria)]|uniref:secondary thiamine-phosphate synthase enzyme YjbQ n=1 Tax=unclassified Bosea (in: a-proteobacteria) TaxID=2653178 RepID=UPI000F757AB7|nr:MULTISPECIES: secondary thiamine-phosphate synthase enzyme YjbQ [unclassified Bosea (in: a-proteobacteria)]AZO76298.1 secondary thiamine-phosphate synthase [Bosea sp. Tri-49]RXT26227.1 secondary thiamine-phosphate synthase [Bosea sp. Tri-39]RXT31469.1 secondary thiamine-phosphate synthase [Bosea sp. Tri-54]